MLSKQLKSGIPQRRESMRSIGNASIGAISPRIFIWEGRSIRTRNGVGVPPHPSALVRIVVAIDSSGSSNEDWVEAWAAEVSALQAAQAPRQPIRETIAEGAPAKDAALPALKVALRAQPHMNFAPAKAVRSTADAPGLKSQPTLSTLLPCPTPDACNSRSASSPCLAGRSSSASSPRH